LLFGAALVTGAAHGQTTAGAGSVVVLPLAASISGAYVSNVFVRNPNFFPITLNVRYYVSDSATPPPPAGVPNTPFCPNGNSQITIAANASITLDPAAQCGFPASDIFGMIVLEDLSPTKTNTFTAYSRTELPFSPNGQSGNGFSVEGFPIGNFSSANADSLGLKRTADAPHYRSNCFVGAQNEPVDYQIDLRQGENGAFIGQLNGHLDAWHTVRHLDVFSAAGALAGDYANVRATFSNTDNSAMIAFCTLETSDNGSADFRVAKSVDARDVRQARVACYGQDSCGSNQVSASDPAHLDNVANRNIHFMIIDQPDYVTCNLVPQGRTDLEIMLRAPGNVQSSPIVAGGHGANQFSIYTGDKSTISLGATTRWYIDVQAQAGVSTAPITYGITCRSGNGVSVPWFGTTAPRAP
jgi:hypothetical protein